MNRYVEIGDNLGRGFIGVCTVMLVLICLIVFKRGSMHCACFIYRVVSFVLLLSNEHAVSI